MAAGVMELEHPKEVVWVIIDVANVVEVIQSALHVGEQDFFRKKRWLKFKAHEQGLIDDYAPTRADFFFQLPVGGD